MSEPLVQTTAGTVRGRLVEGIAMGAIYRVFGGRTSKELQRPRLPVP